MPKIPTFTSRARPTAEVGSVRSNIRIDPRQTTGAALSSLAGTVEDYYIKQRDNNEKLETRKKFYEIKSESDSIIEKYKNNPDEFNSVNGYNEEFDIYKNQTLSQIKNKRVKKRLENLLSIEQDESIYKIKKNSFQAFEKEENQTYKNSQTILASERNLETSPEKKETKLNQRIELAKEHENIHFKGKAWLDKEIQIIKLDSTITDVSKLIYSNPRQAYLNLKNKDKFINLNLKEDARDNLIKEAKGVLIPEIRNEYRNFVAAAAVGENAPFDVDFAKEILPTRIFTTMMNDYNSIKKTVSNIKTLNTIPNQDLSKTLDNMLLQSKKSTDFIQFQKQKQKLLEAVKTRNEAMASDPVLFLNSTNNDIKILSKELKDTTNNDLRIQKKKKLTEILVQTQLDMGQPNYQIKVMSKFEADDFVERYTKGDQNIRVAMLQNLNTEFDNYNSNAMLQLSAAGLPVTAELSSFFNNPKITEKFLSFDEKDEQNRLRKYAKDNNINFNTLRSDVRGNLKNFENIAMRGSSFNNTVALEKIDNIVETLTFLTLSNMSANSGKSESSARTESVDLIKGSFNIQETFFIPLIYDGKSIASSADFIAEKASLIKTFYLEDFNPVAFQSMDEDVTEVELTEAMKDQMKNFGEWRNTADGTGLIYGIVFNDGSFGPVVNKDGENLKFNFDDLSLSIPGTDKNIDFDIRTKSQEFTARGAYPAIPESIKSTRTR